MNAPCDKMARISGDVRATTLPLGIVGCAALLLCTVIGAAGDAPFQGGNTQPTERLALPTSARQSPVSAVPAAIGPRNEQEPHAIAVSNGRLPIETLVTGVAARGERIFFTNAQVICHKCHRVNGQGASVGPDLSRIGAIRSREYLLESLLEPNRVIAEGYSTLLVQTSDGALVFGVVREDSEEQIRLIDVEGREHVIAANDIEERRPGHSAMPGDLQQRLSAAELSDLIEYLASLK